MSHTRIVKLFAVCLVFVFLGTALAGTAEAPEPTEPGAGFGFKVLIDGSPIASFSEVSGLKAEVDVIEFRSGDETGTVRKTPGATKYSNIVLRRAYTRDSASVADALWQWFTESTERRRDAREGRIEIFDRSGKPIGSWCFHEAWIARWVGPVLPTDGSGGPFEVVELAHEGFDRCESEPVVEPKS